MSEGNGASGPAAVMTPKQAAEIINQQVALPAQVFVRGCVASAVGVPPNVLLPAIARQVAAQLAAAVIGSDVNGAVTARRDFEAAFKDGLSKVPVIQPAPQSGMVIKT